MFFDFLQLLIELLYVFRELVIDVFRVRNFKAALRQLTLDTLPVYEAALHLFLLLTENFVVVLILHYLLN